MPLAHLKPSRSIVVHRLDLDWWADSPHSIGGFCCRSSARGPRQSQQSQLRGSAMAGRIVLLVRTCIRTGAERLRLSDVIWCKHCGGRFTRGGLRCHHHHPWSDDRRQAHRSICVHRGLQYERMAIRWYIVAGGPLIDSVSFPRVSATPFHLS